MPAGRAAGNSNPHFMQTRLPGWSERTCFVPHFGHSTPGTLETKAELCCSLTLSIALA